MRPDISILSATDRDDPAADRLHWRAVDLWIENKKDDSYDVFRDLEEMKEEAKAKQNLTSHINWTKTAYKVSGQLIAYATAIHRCQFRVFSFSVALFGETGRLLRWDRSGIVYTKPFNWYTEQETFFEFLWRLNHLPDVDRGYDTTVISARGDEADTALLKLKTYPGFEDVKVEDLHKFLVRDDCTSKGRIKYYITPRAIWDSETLFGRSTMGYIAYDVETTNLVYLKDFWRTDLPGFQSEGDVYRELQEAQVSNIAKLGLAGDVPKKLDCTDADDPSDVQRTRTQEFVRGFGGGHDWCPGRPCVSPYVHYRLVLETLGRPLTTFKSTRQLCEVIRDALVGAWGSWLSTGLANEISVAAHTEAYDRVQILHRDVSAGNILITEEGSGVLIDWDLSKKVVKDGSAKQRQHSRTVRQSG